MEQHTHFLCFSSQPVSLLPFPFNFCSPLTPAPWELKSTQKSNSFKEILAEPPNESCRWKCVHIFSVFPANLRLYLHSPPTSVPFNSCTMRSLNPKQKSTSFIQTLTEPPNESCRDGSMCTSLFSTQPVCLLPFPFHTCVKKTCSYTYTPPSVCGPTFSYILMRRLQL